MGEKQFRIQPRGFYAAFGEEVGAFLDGFENGHASNLNFTRRMQSLFAGYFLTRQRTSKPME